MLLCRHDAFLIYMYLCITAYLEELRAKTNGVHLCHIEFRTLGAALLSRKPGLRTLTKAASI